MTSNLWDSNCIQFNMFYADVQVKSDYQIESSPVCKISPQIVI